MNPPSMKLAFIITGFLFILMWKVVDRRSTDLSRLARKLSMQYDLWDNGKQLLELMEFPLFKHGYAKKVSYILTGTYKKFPITVFDYRFKTKDGKKTRKWTQTVVLIPFEHFKFPVFIIDPKGIVNDSRQVVEYKDVDLTQYPEFSENYIMQGLNNDRLKYSFTQQTMNYIVEHPGISLQMERESLIFFRENEKVPIKSLTELMDQAVRVYRYINFLV